MPAFRAVHPSAALAPSIAAQRPAGCLQAPSSYKAMAPSKVCTHHFTSACARQEERPRAGAACKGGQRVTKGRFHVGRGEGIFSWLPFTLAACLVSAAAAGPATPGMVAPTSAPAFLGSSPTWGTTHFRPAGLNALFHKLQQAAPLKVQLPSLEMPKPSVQGICNLAAGGIAGAVASAITCPLEVIKTNLQSRAARGSGLQPLSMASKILAEQGPKGLYRGLSLSLMGIIPTRSCYFWAYGASKGALSGTLGDCSATHMLSAVVAGGLSSTVTCPLWMVKTRMQLQGTSLVDTTKGIIAKDGVKGLYRGLKASYWGLSEGALQFLMFSARPV